MAKPAPDGAPQPPTTNTHSISCLAGGAGAKRGRPFKHSADERTAIRASYWSGAETIVQIARRLGCTTVTISKIVHERP